MNSPSFCKRLLLAAAVLGFTGVALGAFGAHALHDVLEAHAMRPVWETAVLYQLVHAAVLLFIAREAAPRWVGRTFFWGVVLFSGSLYVLALGGPRWIGPLTPLGGFGLLAGWVGLFLHGWRKS
jgi:uncharacterized membrane protein YgdD (TMEM256/DUF423 family)